MGRKPIWTRKWIGSTSSIQRKKCWLCNYRRQLGFDVEKWWLKGGLDKLWAGLLYASWHMFCTWFRRWPRITFNRSIWCKIGAKCLWPIMQIKGRDCHQLWCNMQWCSVKHETNANCFSLMIHWTNKQTYFRLDFRKVGAAAAIRRRSSIIKELSAVFSPQGLLP